MVIGSIAFALADALEADIEAQIAAPYRLNANVKRSVDIGGLELPIKGEIVSQVLNRHNHMILVRMTGNLVLALCGSDDAKHKTVVKAWVCNLLHMRNPENWLEAQQPENAAALETLLGKSIVGRFVRHGSGSKWLPA